VLLADEPTGNLDSKTGETILALLYKLWEDTGLTVVLVSHDPAVAGGAPRVIRLADGRIVEDDRRPEAPEALASEPSFQESRR
jgi:putative ABC transport system ATP-binding protein